MRIDLQAWWRLPQELRFLLAGGYNTAFGFLLYASLYYAAGSKIGYLGAAVLCQAISVTSAFVVYRRLVFGSTAAWQSSFLRFNLSQLAMFFCGTLGLYLLVHFAHINPVLAQAVITLAAVAISYVLHQSYSFRVPPERL